MAVLAASQRWLSYCECFSCHCCRCAQEGQQRKLHLTSGRKQYTCREKHVQAGWSLSRSLVQQEGSAATVGAQGVARLAEIVPVLICSQDACSLQQPMDVDHGRLMWCRAPLDLCANKCLLLPGNSTVHACTVLRHVADRVTW